MNTTPTMQRGAKLASYAAVLAMAAIAEVPVAHASLVRVGATGQDASLMTAQAADPHAPQKVSPGLAVHKAAGVVRSIGDEVVIKHEPIASIGMGAMTMAFKAPKGGLPRNVKPGTSVTFEFVMTPQGEMQLTSIVPAGGAGK